jgi:Skp family chaperone for outer membrane proteins
MLKTHFILSALFLAATSVTQAQTTTPAKVPGDQGAASVNKNLEKNPDNKGLQNAAERLKTNKEKHLEQMKKREDHKEMKTERHEMKSERQGGNSRPEKPGRPGK